MVLSRGRMFPIHPPKLSESKEASPEIMDTKQRRRRVSEAKKKKGFGVSESKEAEGVFLEFLALFMELRF